MSKPSVLIQLIDGEIEAHEEQLRQTTKCVGPDSAETKAEALTVALFREVRDTLRAHAALSEWVAGMQKRARRLELSMIDPPQLIRDIANADKGGE